MDFLLLAPAETAMPGPKEIFDGIWEAGELQTARANSTLIRAPAPVLKFRGKK
jgi:hypothetical protein